MRTSSIIVTIVRADLIRDKACVEGLALFDRIAVECGTPDAVTFAWSPLAALMLATAARDSVQWLREQRYIPVGADLYGANLYGANLRGANLYGVDLYGVDLYGADLYGALRSTYDLPIHGWALKNGALEAAPPVTP